MTGSEGAQGRKEEGRRGGEEEDRGGEDKRWKGKGRQAGKRGDREEWGNGGEDGRQERGKGGQGRGEWEEKQLKQMEGNARTKPNSLYANEEKYKAKHTCVWQAAAYFGFYLQSQFVSFC